MSLSENQKKSFRYADIMEGKAVLWGANHKAPLAVMAFRNVSDMESQLGQRLIDFKEDGGRSVHTISDAIDMIVKMFDENHYSEFMDDIDQIATKSDCTIDEIYERMLAGLRKFVADNPNWARSKTVQGNLAALELYSAPIKMPMHKPKR